MIAELGQFCLALALVLAVLQATVPLYGAAKQNGPLMALGGSASLGLALCVTVSFAVLTYAFVTSDFSVIAVAQHSHTMKPMLYKISGVWGNHEGSLLLWVMVLALFGAALTLFGGNLPPSLKARVLAVQAMIIIGFLMFLIFTSNPFTRLDPAPWQGNGLNPLLQDPGLAFHPPLLYLGYVGFSIAFAFAVAALIEGRVDAAWARWVRPWTLVAWVFLTLGIGLGSWWAYYELGWGGWWFWDPVENASFIPWLTGTALLHSAIVVEKRGTLKAWTVLLAIVTFSMSLLGTFLVRSGILTSVHAFASDPTRGMFILVLFCIAVGASLVLFAIRAPKLESGTLFAPVSRESGLLLNNLLLSTAAATVTLGTLYPLLIDSLGMGKLSVGPPFFNLTFTPLMVPLILIMGMGPFLSWKRADARAVGQRLVWAAGLALLAAVIGVGLANDNLVDLFGALGVALGVWLAVATLIEWADRVQLFRTSFAQSMARLRALPRAAHGMTVAHLGAAVLVVGVSLASAFKEEYIQVQQPGDIKTVRGFDVRFDGVSELEGPNYLSDTGVFTVFRDGEQLWTMTPEKRLYSQPEMQTTEAAIRTVFWGDLYIVVGEPNPTGTGHVTRIFWEPGVPFIWYGVALLAIGGFISLSDRRLRVGAPKARRPETAAPTPQPAE